jgi:eukaryotic-like serine/threonine-protein kinase
MSDNPAHAPLQDTAQNLLFGLLALQNNFISRDVLVAAFGAWIAEKSKPLGQILLDQGHLDFDCHALLMGLVRQHLKLHGEDPEKSLADLGAMGSELRRLLDLGDPELSASLGHVASARRGDQDTDPDATATFLGAPTSSGGRFQVLRLHAAGGLGEVYVARDEEVHREVALKQIKSEYAGDTQSRARFLVEAEITGGLEHPGIVPVYGLGTYDDGRPFYAMRFIRGDSLKGAIARFHADEAIQKNPGLRTLALQKLLRRFLDVCNAISYAHSRGVLHRDLKPGNIMLGDYGETLVVDWGLAKAVGCYLEPAAPAGAERTLRPELGSDVQPTVMGSRLGTPAYMPPEQAAGRLDELGTLSDVYSLGATLYVLLTGQAPFSEPDLPELLRQVERGEFPRPRQIQPWIDRALEAICLKAMSLKARDRYPSPRAVAEDIEHWLADEPVTARRDSLLARSWRWVRKHRTLSTSAAAVVLFAAAGLGIGLQRERQSATRIAAERTEAERRLDQVMTSYEDYFTGFNEDVLRDRKLPPDLLESLLAKPRAFYERLTTELTGKPNPTERERALLGRGRHSLGRILHTLGRHAESEHELEGAVRIYEGLARDNPGLPEYQDNLAECYDKLGIMLADTSRRSEAEEAYGKAIAIHERLMKDYPGAPHNQHNLAGSYVNLGLTLNATGRPSEAELAYGKGIAALERLVKDQPGVPGYQDFLANGYHDLGMVLATTGRRREAEEAYGKAIAVREQLVENHPGVPGYQHYRANGYYALGSVLADAGRRSEAEAAYCNAIAALERLVKDHPGVPGYQDSLANGYHGLGLVLAHMGRSGEAEAASGKAIAVREQQVQDHPGESHYQHSLAGSYVNFGNVLHHTGRQREAEDAYRKGTASLERLVKDQPRVPGYQDFLANGYNNIGMVLAATGRPTEAEDAYGKAIAVRERLVENHPGVPDYQNSLAGGYNNIGMALAATGRRREAEEVYGKAIAVRERLVKEHPGVSDYQHGLAGSYHNIGLVLADAGRRRDAEEAYGKAIAIRERLVAQNPERMNNRSELGGSLNNIGYSLYLRGDFDRAIALYRKAIGHQRAALDKQPQVVGFRQFLSNHYNGLAKALRALGRADEAAGATRDRLKLWPGNPNQLYYVACDFALCVPIAWEAAAKKRYADEAMVVLRTAVAAGWTDAALTARDSDLAPLRDRPDYKALLAKLFDRGFPADPFARSRVP